MLFTQHLTGLDTKASSRRVQDIRAVDGPGSEKLPVSSVHDMSLYRGLSGADIDTSDVFCWGAGGDSLSR